MHPYTRVDQGAESGWHRGRRDRSQSASAGGAPNTFELQIAVNTFTSGKDGLTKQMFKAMKADNR